MPERAGEIGARAGRKLDEYDRGVGRPVPFDGVDRPPAHEVAAAVEVDALGGELAVVGERVGVAGLTPDSGYAGQSSRRSSSSSVSRPRPLATRSTSA